MAKSISGKTREDSFYVGLNHGPGKTATGDKFKPAAFISCELTDAQKAHCKEQAWSWNDFQEAFDALVSEGFRITLSQDSYNNAFSAWLTAPKEGHINSGYILSGRGPNIVAAVGVLLYKHFTVLSGNWQTGIHASSRDQWG